MFQVFVYCEFYIIITINQTQIAAQLTKGNMQRGTTERKPQRKNRKYKT